MGVVSGNILVRLSMFAGRKLPSGPGGEGLSSRRPAPYPGCVASPEGTLPGPARPVPAPRGTPPAGAETPPAGHGAAVSFCQDLEGGSRSHLWEVFCLKETVLDPQNLTLFKK